jgi:hypothetical protein
MKVPSHNTGQAFGSLKVSFLGITESPAMENNSLP